MSFWYLANHLGRRFLREAERLLDPMESLGPGLWRSRVLGRLVFLVSSIDLPVEADSLPLHIVGQEPPAVERAVAQLIATQPDLVQRYGGWVATLHPRAWEEIDAMVRKTKKGPILDFRPAIRMYGLEYVIGQAGLERVAESLGPEKFAEIVGTKRLVKALDKKELADAIDLDDLLANLSPAKRRELKRRLE